MVLVILYKVAAGVTLAAVLAAGTQTYRLHRTSNAFDHYKLQVEADRAERAQAALDAAQQDRWALSQHTTESHENETDFIAMLRKNELAARADAADAERLRDAAEKRAAYYAELSRTGTDAIRYLADRLRRLEAHTVEGAEVVAELRRFVERRDAEVEALQGQIAADRALFESAH